MSELDPQVKVLLEQVQAMAAQRPSLTSQPQMMPGTLWSGCPGMLLRLASLPRVWDRWRFPACGRDSRPVWIRGWH
jgi:hypothetical protein